MMGRRGWLAAALACVAAVLVLSWALRGTDEPAASRRKAPSAPPCVAPVIAPPPKTASAAETGSAVRPVSAPAGATPAKAEPPRASHTETYLTEIGRLKTTAAVRVLIGLDGDKGD
jgi:hypothetical protein